ncbi:MAG: ATP-binding protein [Cyclobacteriaceae bacterium]
MKTRILGLITFSLVLSLTVSGQQKVIDSLELILSGLDSTHTRIEVLCELSDRYLAYQPEKAKKYAEEALRLSEQLQYLRGKTLALNRLGEYDFRQSNYARAIQKITESLRLAEQQNDSVTMEYAYRVLGNINTAGLKRYDTALRYHLKALEIQMAKGAVSRIASSCGSISWIYAMAKRDLAEGHRFADWGIRLADSLHHSQFLAYNYNSKGLLFQSEEKFDSALFYLKRSNTIAEDAKDRTVIAYNSSIMGEILVDQGNYDDALEVLEDAMTLSEEVNFREITKSTHLHLAKAYEGLGDFRKAYRHRVAYEQLNDELLSVEIAEKATLAQLEFLREKQLARIQELQEINAKEKQEKLVLVLFFLIAAAFLITILVLAFKISRDRRAANELLQEKNKEIAKHNALLQEANESKDKILSIIGHDLRAPVGRLRGMLDLLAKNIIDETDFKLHLPKIARQAAGINDTLENLLLWSRTPGLKGKSERLNLKSLIEDCLQLLESSAAEKNIVVERDISDSIYLQANRNELSLVFRNLINNAIKFTNDNGKIFISAFQQEGNISISIRDTGIGMSPDQKARLFDMANKHKKEGTQGEMGTGLGLILTKDVIDHFHGTLDVDSEVNKGTCFTITLAANPGST